MSINQRKADHIRINLEENVAFPTLTTGLERYRFVHQALPELDLDEVDTTRHGASGASLGAPILVSSMTGGTEQAQTINRHLAVAAQERRLAMGVGSQRAGIEQRRDRSRRFRVRDLAPDVLLLGQPGRGAVELRLRRGRVPPRRGDDRGRRADSAPEPAAGGGAARGRRQLAWPAGTDRAGLPHGGRARGGQGSGLGHQRRGGAVG